MMVGNERSSLVCLVVGVGKGDFWFVTHGYHSYTLIKPSNTRTHDIGSLKLTKGNLGTICIC